MRKIPILFCLLVSFVFYQCMENEQQAVQQKSSNTETGEELAKMYCASCHLYPSPDLLDKKTWANYILIRMSFFMGIYHDGQKYVDQIPNQWIEPGIGGERVKAANVYPSQPILTLDELKKISAFYEKNAPTQLPQTPKRSIKVGIPFFEASPFSQKQLLSPLVQSMTVDQANKKVYVAEYKGGIYQYDFKGKLIDHKPCLLYTSPSPRDS